MSNFHMISDNRGPFFDEVCTNYPVLDDPAQARDDLGGRRIDYAICPEFFSSDS